jgi:hypothetical protein
MHFQTCVILKNLNKNIFEMRVEFFVVKLKAQQDIESRKITLGDNTGGWAAIVLPIRLHCDEVFHFSWACLHMVYTVGHTRAQFRLAQSSTYSGPSGT